MPLPVPSCCIALLWCAFHIPGAVPRLPSRGLTALFSTTTRANRNGKGRNATCALLDVCFERMCVCVCECEPAM
uniref:Putative secreted protein n=1 Tax=Anopheles darlingi TaxID=43151 RepID=A0A2M4DH01_ANODA